LIRHLRRRILLSIFAGENLRGHFLFIFSFRAVEGLGQRVKDLPALFCAFLLLRPHFAGFSLLADGFHRFCVWIIE